jgi:hypothetical protein
MIRYLTIAIVFALLIPTERTAAQNNTVGGALLGGAAGGRGRDRQGWRCGCWRYHWSGSGRHARLAIGAAAGRVLLVRRPLLDSLR